MLQDLRYGLRQLWRSPTFTLAAVATLALGIGANTALFSLGNAILAKPLSGIGNSDRLVWVANANRDGHPTTMSYPDYLDFRAGLTQYVDLAAQADQEFALISTGEPERFRGQIVSGNFFNVLRTPFALGRGFAPGEDSVGAPKALVVLSHDLWQKRFGGDSSIIGRSIVVNATPLHVIGVAAAGFNGANLDLPRHIWITMAQENLFAHERAGILERRHSTWLEAVGRLRDGVQRSEVEPAARTIVSRITAAGDSPAPYREGMTARVYSAKSGLPPGSETEVIPLAILSLVVTGLVLLIACANLSNLLLARGVSRRREVAVRLSLGASRARLVRQLFTESALLAAMAGALGLLLAYWGTEWLISSGVLPLQLEVAPDRVVILLTMLATLGAALLFGLLPAFESTRTELASAIKEGAQSLVDRRGARMQSGLVVAQLALSLSLLTTAGLFLRSMHKARTVDIGFEASRQILALSFDLGLQGYSDERASAFVRELRDRVGAFPGVQNVSFTDVLPLGNRYTSIDLTVEGLPAADPTTEFSARATAAFQAHVDADYFATLGMRVLRGRDFTDTDDKSAPGVAIVSERSARAFWPGADPLGKRVSVNGTSGPFLTVVGVVSDVMLGGPTESMRATIYLPRLQHPQAKALTLLARTSSDPVALAGAVRREVRQLDRNLPVFDVRSMAEVKESKLADRMNGARILGGFGGLALLLASIGVYGVMAFTVAQRRREIGIRVALGARGRDVVALFVGRSSRLVLLGAAVGLTVALGMSRLLQGMLFGLTPTDAVTLAGVTVLLAGVALTAAWIPARRVARVNAVEALYRD